MRDYNELPDDEVVLRMQSAKEHLLNVGVPDMNTYTTVWLVIRIEFDGGTSYKVYATKEKAKEAAENFKGMFAHALEFAVN